ncbi:MAG: hypothetical protein KBA30_09190 [Clostridia bacterium]|nr:hypothetical protein [Clostridia bacterium]
MLNAINNAGIMVKGAFIAGMGLLLVFAVLLLFFASIRILGKIGARKGSGNESAD